MRDQFAAKVVETLAKRAGQRCSLCNCPTSGPHDDPSRSVVVGEAAHIRAASPDGPRYDPTQTPEERISAENGIWLCRNDHGLIDRDVDRFSVETLLQLKQDAEDRIRREMGRPATGFTPIFSVPHRRNPYFTGREEVLVKLSENLKTSGKAALGQIAAISGLGGIGKTQTAIEFAYRHREEYRAIFFVVAETEGVLLDSFAGIAKLLGLPQADAPDQQLAAQATKDWLEAEDGWLLILDNADTPERLNAFVSISPRGHVLVTSRAPSFVAIGAEAVQLKAPSTEEAVGFLLKRTRRIHTNDDEREAAQEIASELGNLPLALEQAGAYMIAQQASFVDYLAGYRRRGLELLAKGRVEGGPGHDLVAITWSMNIEEVEKQSLASADLLRAAAFLAPEAIPDELFLDGGAAISSALAEVLESRDPLAVAELAAPLLRYSLVERDAEARTLSIHRLVQKVIRQSLGTAGPEMARRVFRALNMAFPNPPEVATWHRCERLLGQVLSLVNVTEECHEPGLLTAAAGYLYEHARFSEAEALFVQALKILEQHLGPLHVEVGNALNNLALLYIDQERLVEAKGLLLRAMAIYEKFVGTNNSKLAAAFNNIGIVYRKQGDLAAAEIALCRALDLIKNEHDGIFHGSVAHALHNLALLYTEQGKLPEAEKTYMQALFIGESVWSSVRPEIASILNGLGSIFWRRGRYVEAEAFIRRSLAIGEHLLGDHPDVAQSLNNLALLCRKQNRDDEAAKLEVRAEEVMARHRARNPGSSPPRD